VFDPRDERPRPSPDWFSFGFWSPQASFGGHLELWRWPGSGQAWYATAVFRDGEPVVALCDEFPLRSTLELRGNGLWADHNLEDPFVHWSVGLEAFALALDHPGDDRGLRVPLGYDLDWECEPDVLAAVDDGYEQPARVRGEVLLGADSYDLDGWGWRSHRGVGTAPVGVRRRAGWDAAGAPRWTAVDEEVRPGDDLSGWSLSVSPAGRLRKGLFRDGAGAMGVVEQWLG